MRSSFDILVDLVDSFRHNGWVNGLGEERYLILDEANEHIKNVGAAKEKRAARSIRVKTANALRKKRYTIRQICKIMGYKHPGSVSQLLSKK